MEVSARRFQEAMATFPAGVTIVTTVDDQHRWWGFTASAFCSLSLSPPMVLVCLDGKANCYLAFSRAPLFAVNILRCDQTEAALRFSSKNVDKFAVGGFYPSVRGLPVHSDAVAVVECTTQNLIPAGDHTIMIGNVRGAQVRHGRPMLYFGRTFCTIPDAHDNNHWSTTAGYGRCERSA